MTRTRYYVASSLDGYIADRRNRLDWLLQFGFTTFQEHYDLFFASVGAIVMGSATYEWILGEQGDAGPTWEYGTTPTFVLTTRELLAVEGADIRFVRGDVAEIDREARGAAGTRDVWLVGGGDVSAQFAAAGLLDDLQLTVMPVMLGGGVPLLPVAATTRPLTLEGTTRFPGGAVELRYRFG